MINDESHKIEEKSAQPKEQQTFGMHKRRIMMEDRKRYLIYYTFGETEASEKNGDGKNV